MSSISSDISYGLQLDPKTARVIDRFGRRRRVLLVLRGIAAAIIFFVIAMGLVALCDYLWLLSDPVRWLLSGLGYAMTAWALWWYGLHPMGDDNARRIARQIESTDPGLREDLLSAVELADPQSSNGSASLRNWLQESVASRTSGLEVSRLLPVGLIQRWLLAGLIVAVVFAGLLMVPKMQFGRRIARAMLPGLPIERASLTDVSIIEPSPPSGYVAEGDAVAVLVQIGGRAVDDVVMQWRNADGIEGETMMTPRVALSATEPGDTLAHQDIYAANLSVGTTAVEYRIIAGDAITLWHELTPLPRPRVESFRKRLQFPSYSKLSDRVEESEHGDLKALVGTKAIVTIRFDEPVDEATIRFGNLGTSIRLEAVEGSDREFDVTIPIRTPGTYQVDAISRRSGLNNPFSPQYSIAPIVDTPPIARWSDDLPRTMIVSPLDVVPLAAIAMDDLPIDRVIQEFQINGEPALARDVPIGDSDRELKLNWDWDLLRRIDNDEKSIKLASGDIIRTRVVAIDRNSQRGESSLLELLIADEGFDTDRHARLEQLKQLLVQVADWASRMSQWMDAMSGVAETLEADRVQAKTEEAAALQEESEAILTQIAQVCESSATLPEAGSLELIGRALADLAQEQSHWLAGFQQVMPDNQDVWQKSREQLLREHAKQARQFSNDASRLDQYARHVFAEELTFGLLRDAMSLQQSVRPLLDKDSKLPVERFPRYLVVTIGRLQAIDQMIEDNAAAIPDSTSRHFESWQRWSDGWRIRLQVAIEEPPREDAFRELISQFDSELRNQINHGMIDGRLVSTIHSLLREIRIQIGPASDLVRLMAKHGQESEKAMSEQNGQVDSDVSARRHRDQQFAEASFDRARQHLLNRLEQEEALHRSRPSVDLRFAADIKLMGRAIENVAKDGYAPYRDEPAPSVYQNLATAYQVLEAKHEADLWLAEIRQLMLAERRLDETATNKVKHPSWLERYASGLEWPARTLQNAGIPWEELEEIDRARYNDDYNQARNRITTRRWSGDPMLSAESSLERLQQGLSDVLDALEPRVTEARATIERYVLTLSEQAREAAEEARQAKQRTESRPNSEASTADQLAKEQERAEEATRQTLESLVDLANTASLTDPGQRELARDADISATQIQQAARQAEDSIKEATQANSDQQRLDALDQTAEALNELSETLERTAEHFEKAESGEDLSQSREQLRESEAALAEQGDLQERYDRAEELAETAQSSPQEMMRQLEDELQENQPMQQELSEIARRAAEAAQRSLEQAARDERAVSQSMERSDAEFQERKQRAAREIASLSRRATAVDQSLLQAVERAVGWANTPEAKPNLDQSRKTLREAVDRANRLGGDLAPLSDLKQAAGELAKSIETANQTLQTLNEQSAAAQENDIHKDDASRKRTEDQLERFARDARSQQLRAASNEQQQWSSAKQDAGRRIQDAQRQKRDAEGQQRQLRQRLDREPKNAESLQAGIGAAQARIDRALRAEQAANESREFAEQQADDARARENEIKTKAIDPFDKPNPASQLAVRMSEEAKAELARIRDSLDQLAQAMNFEDQLRVPESQSQQLADQQQRIQQDVGEAAEQLRRAARHEQRLGQEELSQQLDAAAEAVSENAATAAQKAADSLQQASSQPSASPEANQRVAQAAEQIQQAADQLAQMLSLSMSETDEAATNQAQSESQNQASGEQLARTLDELDRQMASSERDSQQTDQQADSAASGQPQPSQAATAQDASPTLAGAVDAQSQQAARQRQEQLDPSQGQPGNQGEPTSQSASNSSATLPGSGQMPGDGYVDTSGIGRQGSDWGQLRERRTDDVTEGRAATIAPQYRREIEAYFRAIARRAAEKDE